MKIDNVFDDPGAICRLVESNGPYRTMTSYLPKGSIGGAESAVLPWFRGTWGAAGRTLVDGADAILHNPRLLGAAAQLVAAEVAPNTVVVNVNQNGSTSQSNLTVDNNTTYTKRASATSAAITQGECLAARGTVDTSGALQATNVTVAPAQNGSCRDARR